MIQKIKKTVRIPKELEEYLIQNRRENLFPSSVSEWVVDQLQEHKIWASNRDMAMKIQTLINRMDTVLRRLDTHDLKLLNLEEKARKK